MLSRPCHHHRPPSRTFQDAGASRWLARLLKREFLDGSAKGEARSRSRLASSSLARSRLASSSFPVEPWRFARQVSRQRYRDIVARPKFSGDRFALSGLDTGGGPTILPAKARCDKMHARLGRFLVGGKARRRGYSAGKVTDPCRFIAALLALRLFLHECQGVAPFGRLVGPDRRPILLLEARPCPKGDDIRAEDR